MLGACVGQSHRISRIKIICGPVQRVERRGHQVGVGYRDARRDAGEFGNQSGLGGPGGDADEADRGVEDQLVGGRPLDQCEGGSDRGVAAERHLVQRREVADVVDVRLVGARCQEGALGIAHLRGDGQHLRRIESTGIEDDAGRVAALAVASERRVPQDLRCHGSQPKTRPRPSQQRGSRPRPSRTASPIAPAPSPPLRRDSSAARSSPSRRAGARWRARCHAPPD